jgi:hypothetical protein
MRGRLLVCLVSTALAFGLTREAWAWSGPDHPAICSYTYSTGLAQANARGTNRRTASWSSILGSINCDYPDNQQGLGQNFYSCGAFQPGCWVYMHNQSHFGDNTRAQFAAYNAQLELAITRARQGWGSGCCDMVRDYAGFAMHFGQDRTASGHAWNPPNASYTDGNGAGSQWLSLTEDDAADGRMHGHAPWKEFFMGTLSGPPGQQSLADDDRVNSVQCGGLQLITRGDGYWGTVPAGTSQWSCTVNPLTTFHQRWIEQLGGAGACGGAGPVAAPAIGQAMVTNQYFCRALFNSCCKPVWKTDFFGNFLGWVEQCNAGCRVGLPSNGEDWRVTFPTSGDPSAQLRAACCSDFYYEPRGICLSQTTNPNVTPLFKTSAVPSPLGTNLASSMLCPNGANSCGGGDFSPLHNYDVGGGIFYDYQCVQRNNAVDPCSCVWQPSSCGVYYNVRSGKYSDQTGADKLPAGSKCSSMSQCNSNTCCGCGGADCAAQGLCCGTSGGTACGDYSCRACPDGGVQDMASSDMRDMSNSDMRDMGSSDMRDMSSSDMRDMASGDMRDMGGSDMRDGSAGDMRDGGMCTRPEGYWECCNPDGGNCQRWTDPINHCPCAPGQACSALDTCKTCLQADCNAWCGAPCRAVFTGGQWPCTGSCLGAASLGAPTEDETPRFPATDEGCACSPAGRVPFGRAGELVLLLLVMLTARSLRRRDER